MELVYQVVPRRVEGLERNYLSRDLGMDELEAAMKELKN
jgi:hypothetical protein